MTVQIAYEKFANKTVRTYTVNGKKYYSVTSILDSTKGEDPPALKQWKKNLGYQEAERIKNESAKIGEIVHYYCLQNFKENSKYPMHQDIPEFITNGNTTIDKLVIYKIYLNVAKLLFQDFLKVWKDRIEIVNIEFLVVNTKIGYAGRCDFAFILDNKYRCIGDIKTGKAVYEHYPLQIAAYANGDKPIANLGGNPERFFILRIHPYHPDHDPLGIQTRYKGPHWDFVEIQPNFEMFKARVKYFRSIQQQVKTLLSPKEQENAEDILFG